MSEPKSPLPDPFAMWREWVNQSERQWNTFFNDVMATDQYTQSMGRFVEAYVSGQKSLADTMARGFAALNVASRTDVLSLGDRLAAIEHRLARIEARLDPTAAAAGGRGSGEAVPPTNRPPRTKTPPAQGSGRTPT